MTGSAVPPLACWMFTNARDNYQVISLVVEAEAHKFVLSIPFVSPHR